MSLIERLQKREHYFRNASEGEYDANLIMHARFALEAADKMADAITTILTLVKSELGIDDAMDITGMPLIQVLTAYRKAVS